MYPNATISGGGGAEDWKSRLPQGFDQSKIPAGANGVTKDGDVYIFTKDGNALPNGKYNADGSVFTGTQDSGAGTQRGNGTSSTGGGAADVSSQLSGQGATGGNGTFSAGPVNFGSAGASLFGNGFTSGITSGYGDLSSSWASGSFDVDPARLMQSAEMLQGFTNMAGNIPFGLGGIFAQGPLQALMQNFMNAVSFKFDFSSFNFAATPATTTTTTTTSSDDQGTSAVPDGYTATDVAGVFKKGDKYYKYNDNNQLVECNANGSKKTTQGNTSGNTSGNTHKVVPSGYTETGVNGVFKKGDKYYKYDSNNSLVECQANGSSLPAAKPSPAPRLSSYDQFIETNTKAGFKLKSVLNKDGSHTVTDKKNGYVYNFNTNGQLVSKIAGNVTTEHTYANGNSFKPTSTTVTDETSITTTKYEKTTEARANKDKFIEDLNKAGITEINYNGNDVTYTEGNHTVIVKFDDDGLIVSKTTKLNNDTNGDYTTTVSYKTDGYVVTTEKSLTDKGKKKRGEEAISASYWDAYANMAFK